MGRLPLICILMVFWRIVEPQRLFAKRIPPIEDVGFCECQVLPGLPGGTRSFLQLPKFGITFTLFTPSPAGTAGVPISVGETRVLNEAGFNANLPLTVITHGWTESTTETDWIHDLRKALQAKAPMNILLVDWSNFSRLDYTTAALHTALVGRRLAEFLTFIQRSYPGFTGNQVHLIGFSMGAHVSGVAGHLFPGIARITGLDPAGPNFECVTDSLRLDPSDAMFVDNVHTNSGCAVTGHIGYTTPHGHLDFYVNGGGEQPGCRPLIGEFIFDSLLLRWPNICHHTRAIKHYIDSIHAGSPVYGFLCQDYKTYQTGACQNNFRAVFGYHASPEGLPRGGSPTPLFFNIQVWRRCRGNGCRTTEFHSPFWFGNLLLSSLAV
ncbi:endothelial lipase-like isoform X1 [Macrobrachium rosenbergii]|uniref:endothelial lipase-like isoform X1 n=1 Tax=Macrobrachium rosenbergii TaxID=79674 RepID=UPI0034D413D2